MHNNVSFDPYASIVLIRREVVAAGSMPKKKLNLALQGGGAHGALTWGALDALLARGGLELDGVSGTSAGAVNAVALAAGFMEGGADGAREKLDDVWRAISKFGAPGAYPAPLLGDAPSIALSGAVMERSLRQLAKMWSPFDLNPLDINPLREILEAKIDFARLARESPVALFVAATEVTSGRARIFRSQEISVDAVLASACLPTLSPTIRIGRFHYWDGGFSANPDLVTLISETRARDTLLVQISPDRDPVAPASSERIAAAISRLTFNQPLRSQIEHIETCRQVPRLSGLIPHAIRRLGVTRLHLIDASRHALKLREETKLRPDWSLIANLRDQGRSEAETWMDAELRKVGRRSSTDLYARYFTDRLPFD